MIRHNIETALLAFRKAPFTTAANILTLALGLACFIAAWSIATYWRSADAHHRHADRTVVVGQSLSLIGRDEVGELRNESAASLGKYLRQDIPELERVARLFVQEDAAVVAGEAKLSLDVAVVEPQFLELFDFTFLAGDPASALTQPGSVVLTQETAERMFADRAALGQAVRLPDGVDAIVTGVIAPVRQPSFMGASADSIVRFDLLQDWASHPGGVGRDARDFWRGANVMTFARLAPNASIEAVNARFPAFVQRRMPPEDRAFLDLKITAFPVSDITTRALDNTFFGDSRTGLTVVAALLGLGVLILVVACVNYGNLAAAQAAAREREFGMRKVLGAGRGAVLAQVWLESLILAACAAILAIAVLAAAAPVIRVAANVDLLHIFRGGAVAWARLAALIAGVAAACAAYPAITLLGVSPAWAVKARRASGARGLARVLVGVQFASASFLLIVVTVAQFQRAELERAALAGVTDPIVSLGNVRPLGVDPETLEALLLRSPAVEAVTVAEFVPWSGGRDLGAFARSPEASQTAPIAHFRHVGFGYFDALGLDILAGRGFERSRDAPGFDPAGSDPYDVVLDAEFAARLGFAAPQAAVGETIYTPARPGRAARALRVIGVAEHRVQHLAKGEASGAVYVLDPNSPFFGQVPIVRLSAKDAARGLAHVERTWEQLAPNAPLRVEFYDQLFEQAYRQYGRMSQLFILLAGVAFAIASTGILGIAVHVAARRRREIAVRKVLGSTTLEAVWLLLADFSKPVVIANLIAWPAGYLAAEAYLSAFAHRIELTAWPFALSMIITLAIAWLAVGGQTFKAASTSPAQVLRGA